MESERFSKWALSQPQQLIPIDIDWERIATHLEAHYDLGQSTGEDVANAVNRMVQDYIPLLSQQGEGEKKGDNNAWPVNDVLKNLANAASILLRKHDYDGHNHEEIQHCIKRANELIKPTQDQPSKSTSELFTKHFGDTISVDLKHPNMENFFNELNKECLKEDIKKKKLEH